jgi:hypothetical protein
MTRINNADQMLRLLRTKLEQAGTAAKRKQAASPAAASQASRASGTRTSQRLKRTRDIVVAGTLGEAAAGRMLVAGLLAETLGEDMINEPGFQDVIDQVWSVLEQDADSSRLVKDALNELGKQTP